MKFKAGDKVKLKHGLKVNERYGNLTLLSGMITDEELTIKCVTYQGNYQTDIGYAYSEEMLYPSFNIGDIVYVSCESKWMPGERGTIVRIKPSQIDWPYEVKSLDNPARPSLWILPEYLQRIEKEEMASEYPSTTESCKGTSDPRSYDKGDYCGTTNVILQQESDHSILSVNTPKVKLYML